MKNTAILKVLPSKGILELSRKTELEREVVLKAAKEYWDYLEERRFFEEALDTAIEFGLSEKEVKISGLHLYHEFMERTEYQPAIDTARRANLGYDKVKEAAKELYKRYMASQSYQGAADVAVQNSIGVEEIDKAAQLLFGQYFEINNYEECRKVLKDYAQTELLESFEEYCKIMKLDKK